MAGSQLQSINGNFKGKDILSIDQFSKKDIELLFQFVPQMRSICIRSQDSVLLKGHLVTLIFYEPSSRTFGSFCASVKQLGAHTIEVQNPQQFSSISKGETFEDTIRVFEAYSDAIVIRHPEVGSAKKAAQAAKFIPIINAGDGPGEHPTQTLLDLYTIFEKKNRLNNLVGVFAGDMLYGRTVKSLIRGLALYSNNTLYLLSAKELRLTQEEFSDFSKRGAKLIEIDNEQDIPKNADFWYWTRTQKERFKNQSDYERVKSKFIVTKKLLNARGGKDLLLMHPLPRVGEIETEVDNDKRAVYLTSQIRNGMYVRMALLALVLGKA